MLRSTHDLQGFALRAKDGEIGHVDDFYFDDETWTIRYVVVETGRWLGRRVLVSPISFVGVDWRARAMDVSLTREQIRNSPGADLQSPISRQFERGFFAYYGYSPYWGTAEHWTPAVEFGAAPGGASREGGAMAPAEHEVASHLHRSREVTGYHIQAVDGDIGHVDDLLFDDANWTIEYLRVDTSNWIGGKPVLVPRRALAQVRWREMKIRVELSRDEIRNRPEFDPSQLPREPTASR